MDASHDAGQEQLEPQTSETINQIEQALADLDAQLQAEAAADKEKRRQAHLEFTAIVARDDLPKRGDAKRLAALIRELGISIEDARSEVKAIHQARALLPKASGTQRAEITENTRVARLHLEEVQKRHKEELEQCQQHLNECQSQDASLEAARHSLRELHRSHPHIFDADGMALPETCRFDWPTRPVAGSSTVTADTPREIYRPGSGWEPAFMTRPGQWRPIDRIVNGMVHVLGDDNAYPLHQNTHSPNVRQIDGNSHVLRIG